MPYKGYYAHHREAIDRMLRELDTEEEMLRSKEYVDSDYVEEAIHFLYEARKALLFSETRNWAEDQEE